jgi:hypothetical protein
MAIVGTAVAKRAAWVERSRARNQEDQDHFVRPLLLLEEMHLSGQIIPSPSGCQSSPINHC